VDDDVPPEQLRAAIARNDELTGTFRRAWPLLDASELVGDLWSVPAYLRRCAPWLSPEEVRALQRDDPQAWTVHDLPLLDAARQRIGDRTASLRRRGRDAAEADERRRMDEVIDYLLETDDDAESSLSLLRRESLRNDLVDDAALPTADPDLLAGPFSHIVVDEAQELTDAEWQLLLRRCPSRSFTIVGDRAQARHGFAEPWAERLERVGFDHVAVATLNINYRTPVEVMAEAEPVIRAVLPDASVPTSVRSTGVPVSHGSRSELHAVVDSWLATNDGIACVIGDPGFAEAPRVHSFDAEHSKGLEFDLVVLVAPETWGAGIEGQIDRYVAMTRATQQLVILGA
jgi:DNA helicase IV